MAKSIIQSVYASSSDQDRVFVHEESDRVVIVVADGAGGISGGAAAATWLCEQVEQEVLQPSGESWGSLLFEWDAVMARSAGLGWSTAVVVEIQGGEVWGASVGDSEAWFVTGAGKTIELTQHQRQKPLLGTGEALPVEFLPILPMPWSGGTLLVGSDGLFKYAKYREWVHLVHKREEGVENQLIGLVKLPSGELVDDVSIVMVWDE